LYLNHLCLGPFEKEVVLFRQDEKRRLKEEEVFKQRRIRS